MFPTGGTRGSNLRQWRYGAIAVIVIAGLVFHGRGAVYSVIRIAYFALIIGLIAVRARQRGPRRGQRSPWGGPVDAGAGSTTPLNGSLATPGWFPDPSESGVERYWDGSTWTRRRRFDGVNWVEENVPPLP